VACFYLAVAALIALAVGALIVARLVRVPQLGLGGPVTLLAAVLLAVVLCLILVHCRVRQIHPRWAAATACGRYSGVAQAVAGPCDGQQVGLPAGLPLPAEFWLAAEAAGSGRCGPAAPVPAGAVPADPPRYRHAPTGT